MENLRLYPVVLAPLLACGGYPYNAPAGGGGGTGGEIDRDDELDRDDEFDPTIYLEIILHPVEISGEDDSIVLSRDEMIQLIDNSRDIKFGTFSPTAALGGSLRDVLYDCTEGGAYLGVPCGCEASPGLTDVEEQALSNLTCIATMSAQSAPVPPLYPSSPHVADYAVVLGELLGSPVDSPLLHPLVVAPIIADAAIPELPLTLRALIGDLEPWGEEIPGLEYAATTYQPDHVRFSGVREKLEGGTFELDAGWREVIIQRAFYPGDIQLNPLTPKPMTLDYLEFSLDTSPTGGLGRAVGRAIDVLSGCSGSSKIYTDPTTNAAFYVKLENEGGVCEIGIVDAKGDAGPLPADLQQFATANKLPRSLSNFASDVIMNGLPYPDVPAFLALSSVAANLDVEDTIASTIEQIHEEGLQCAILGAEPEDFDFFYYVDRGEQQGEEFLLVGAVSGDTDEVQRVDFHGDKGSSHERTVYCGKERNAIAVEAGETYTVIDGSDDYQIWVQSVGADGIVFRVLEDPVP